MSAPNYFYFLNYSFRSFQPFMDLHTFPKQGSSGSKQNHPPLLSKLPRNCPNLELFDVITTSSCKEGEE